MTSLYFVAPGNLEWRAQESPRLIDGGDALVRPVVATTCDIDPLIISGRAPLRGPFAIGHEAIGEVVEVGRDVAGMRPGDRVVMSYYDACGHCARCGQARPNRCLENSPDLVRRNWHGIGFTPTGYFSDLVRVPAADYALRVLPAEVEPTHLASLGDNIGFAWEYVVPHLDRTPGADVLVMGGSGSIGLYAVGIAIAAGANAVTYVDQVPARLAIAERYGATVVEGPPPRSIGSFPITVDASADAASLVCALRSTEVEGHCSSVGGHFAPVELPLFEMYARGVHFYTGPGRGIPNVDPALALIQSGRFDPAPVTSGLFPFDDAAKVLTEPGLKPVFVR
ncbi:MULTISPECIES: zinc-dependent alcohol dehydrogenase [unclassified Sphingomonas]|uniref:zinc-dependent alcohol dehydrogenase n=1 Tax=unclassified Sphingomonas TaxID=196159 RepID=UPI000829CDA1|nr:MULTISPECIES: alcohol dehydrogenase catalytic domain-containing protein [unclassified Sphingomonas]